MMKELLDVNEAAKRLRDLTIERNIVHLKSQIAQSEASELHNRARKLDHEVMCAAGDLSKAATVDVPEIFMTNIGGDNEAAKQMIARLVVLRDKKEYHPPAITTVVKIPKDFALDKAVGETFAASVGFKPEDREVDEYMAKSFAQRFDKRSLDEETKKRPVLIIGCHCPEGKCEHVQPMRLTDRELDESEALATKARWKALDRPQEKPNLLPLDEDMSPWDSTTE